MAGLNASELLVKQLGDLYLRPVSELGPPDADDLGDDDALLSDGWVNLGWIAADGVSTDGFEGDTTPLVLWNRVAAARTLTTVAAPSITVPFAQWNTETLKRYFPGASYDAGTRTLTVPEGGNSAPEEMLIVVQDGDNKVGLWVGRVQARPGGTLEFPDEAESPIPVAFDVLSTGDPSEWLALVGIDPPSEEGSSA